MVFLKELLYEYVCKTDKQTCFQDYRVLKKAAPSICTVVGFKLSGPFKFFFDIINVRVTFLDVKGPIK